MVSDEAPEPVGLAARQQPTLRQLMIFDAVMEGGTVGAAARHLRLSQPAVTHALHRLEHLVGTALLQRRQAGSSGTPAGLIFHRRVIRLRALIMEGIAGAAGADDPANPGRVAALTSSHVAAHVAIARQGSFRGAARTLGISEPAIQRTARDLETMIGAPLYRRQGQNVGVTPGGQLLASRLQLALAEIDQAFDEIEMAQGIANGRVRLGCLPLMPKDVLAAALGRLLRRFPNVQVSLDEGSYDRLIAALKRGELDMLIGALRHDPHDSEIEERFLFDDPYVVVCRRGHPLAGPTRHPGRDDLAAQNWVAAPSDTPRRAALERVFAGLPRRPTVVLETNSVAMMVATLSESDCLTLISQQQALRDFHGTELAQLSMTVAPGDRQVGISLRRNWLPTAVQGAFLDALG
jgi:LysR family transcriptional regulator, regulator for genes of the gallate degradation pathway